MTQIDDWPPIFTLDQEAILNLLTGDRFYSNPSAALREAVLNAIDAIHRRRNEEMELEPRILVIFNREKCTLSVSDNGVGMDSNDVKELFAKVGASAAKAEAKKDLNR
jgi:HSP90 family molecular chaperone